MTSTKGLRPIINKILTKDFADRANPVVLFRIHMDIPIPSGEWQKLEASLGVQGNDAAAFKLLESHLRTGSSLDERAIKLVKVAFGQDAPK